MNEARLAINDLNIDSKIFLIYFSTRWQGCQSLKYLARIITQIVTKSQYEHVAIAIKCPIEYDGKTYVDTQGRITVKAGEYYVFEATHHAGVVINPLENRILNPSYDLKEWSGSIDVQSPTDGLKYDSKASWEHATNALLQPYNTVLAIFSAIDGFKFIRRVRSILNHSQKKYSGLFCSMFAILNIHEALKHILPMTIDTAMTYTPEELNIFFIEQNICQIPTSFAKYNNGLLIGINNHLYK